MTIKTIAGLCALTLPAIALAGSATAADWSGFYAGAYGESTSVDIVHNYDFDVEFGYTATGGTGGVMLGYNLQSGNIVYGVEGDFNFGGATGSGLCDGGTVPLCIGSGSEPTFTLGQVMTLRARAGFVNGNTLIYGAVGVSQADVNVVDVLQPATVDETHAGYVAAIGIEWMLQDSLTLGAEYQYGSYEALSYPLVSTPDEIGFETSAIRVSVKYLF